MEENDHELETEKRRMEFDSEIKGQRQRETLMRKEQDSLIRGLDMMMKDKEKVAKEQADASHEIRRLTSQSEELKRQVAGLQKERKEQEKNSTQQEKRITDYKQKVSTLKKFKYVLDFRLREVSESLMPKERQIEQLKAQIHDFEAEFEKQLAVQQKVQQTLELRNQKIAQLQEEVKKQESFVTERNKRINQFENELYDLVHDKDQRDWAPHVKELYQKYVKKERTSKSASETHGVEEITKQMGLMEKKITSFAVKSERAELACKVDTQRKAMENSLLIHELNELRYEKKNLESKLRNYELAMNSKAQAGVTSTAVVKAAPSGTGVSAEKQPPAGSAVQVARAPSVGRLRRGLPSATHMTADDKERMAAVLRQVDLQQQENTMQKLELKVLRDQVSKLLDERKALLGEDTSLQFDFTDGTGGLDRTGSVALGST